MPGTVTVSHYAAAGNPRTSHSAMAPTNERVSEATKLAEVAVSWFKLHFDRSADVCTWSAEGHGIRFPVPFGTNK